MVELSVFFIVRGSKKLLPRTFFWFFPLGGNYENLDPTNPATDPLSVAKKSCDVCSQKTRAKRVGIKPQLCQKDTPAAVLQAAEDGGRWSSY